MYIDLILLALLGAKEVYIDCDGDGGGEVEVLRVGGRKSCPFIASNLKEIVTGKKGAKTYQSF